MLAPERRQSRQDGEEVGSSDSENTSSREVTLRNGSLNMSIDLGQRFLTNDSFYLQFLLTSIFPGGRNLIHSTQGRNVIVSAFRMDFTIVGASLSPSIRAALLVLGSYLKEGNNSAVPFSYYQAWCTAANQDIANYHLEELVLSTYIMTVYASFKREERETLLVHARQFCRILEVLVSGGAETVNHELSWYETLWQPVITTVYHATRESQMDSTISRNILRIGQADGAISTSVKQGTVGNHLGDLKALADMGIRLWAGSNHFPADKRSFRRLRSLIICLRIHYEQFLYQTYYMAEELAGSEDVNYMTEELRQIMEIARLCPDVEDTLSKAYEFGQDPLGLEEERPDSESEFLQSLSLVGPLSPTVLPIRTSLLYCASSLVRGLLDPSFDFDPVSKSPVYRSAIALCRLCSSILRQPSVTKGDCASLARSLFWASLLLKKSTHPLGT